MCDRPAMDAEDEPLLLEPTGGDLGEDGMPDEEDPEDTEVTDSGVTIEGANDRPKGLWQVVGWVYTTPWASGVVLGLGFLLPFALSAYMFLCYLPLDIDLSYSAFEVRSHSSAQHFDSLTIALKTQLGAWDRHRRNADDYDSDILRDLLLAKLNMQGGSSGSKVSSGEKDAAMGNVLQNDTAKATSQVSKEEATGNVTVTSSDVKKMGDAREKTLGNLQNQPGSQDNKTSQEGSNSPSSLAGQKEDREKEGGGKTRVRRTRSADYLPNHILEGSLNGSPLVREEGREGRGPAVVRSARSMGMTYSYLQSQALWRMELVFVAQGSGSPNIFTPERLHTIHRVERLLMEHPQFQQFCWKPVELLRDLPLGPSFCSPPSSLLSYLFPSERGGKIYFDGMGPDLADVHGESAANARGFPFPRGGYL